MEAEQIKEAMLNLSGPEYSAIRSVFGRVLDARSKQPKADCSLLSLLAKKAHILELLDEDCAVYVREIGLADAQKKCKRELLGLVKRPAVEFNGGCGDFWAEMAAIRVLKSKGYCRFRPIFTARLDGTTSDYEAYLGGAAVHIEVKNIRSIKTVLDVFMREVQALHDSNPGEAAFNIQIEYPYDRQPTGKQERSIHGFVASILKRELPFQKDLDLDDATARIKVVAGSGTTMMTRSIKRDSPEPLDKKKFLGKVRDKAIEASGQMKDPGRLKVLVINFDSPSGSVPEDFIHDAKNAIRAEFSGPVDPYVLHHRYLPD